MPKYGAPMIALTGAQTWSALQTFSANIVTPVVIGGTGTTSTLVLQPTSGVGASGADIIFKVGNNGATEAGRFNNAGQLLASNGSAGSLSYAFSGASNVGAFMYDTNTLALRSSTGSGMNVGQGFVRLGTSLLFWGSDFNVADVGFSRDSEGALVLSGVSGATTASLGLKGDNGQRYKTERATELVAVGSGIITKATTIQIPADATVKAIPVYVKTKPGGTATMTVTSTTGAHEFQKGANISTNAGTSDPGNKATPRNYNGTAAQTVTFTFDAPTTDALGEIRVDIYYETSTPPTS